MYSPKITDTCSCYFGVAGDDVYGSFPIAMLEYWKGKVKVHQGIPLVNGWIPWIFI